MDPSRWQVFEDPWLTSIVMILVGLIAARVGIARRSRAVVGIGAAVGVLGMLLIPLAALIETPSEEIHSRTMELIERAIAGDRDALDSMLDRNVIMVVGADRLDWDREQILRLIPNLPSVVESNYLRRVEASADAETIGRSEVAQTTMSRYGRATPNEWRFIWKRTGEGPWRVVELNWLTWNGEDVPSARMLSP